MVNTAQFAVAYLIREKDKLKRVARNGISDFSRKVKTVSPFFLISFFYFKSFQSMFFNLVSCRKFLGPSWNELSIWKFFGWKKGKRRGRKCNFELITNMAQSIVLKVILLKSNHVRNLFLQRGMHNLFKTIWRKVKNYPFKKFYFLHWYSFLETVKDIGIIFDTKSPKVVG